LIYSVRTLRCVGDDRWEDQVSERARALPLAPRKPTESLQRGSRQVRAMGGHQSADVGLIPNGRKRKQRSASLIMCHHVASYGVHRMGCAQRTTASGGPPARALPVSRFPGGRYWYPRPVPWRKTSRTRSSALARTQRRNPRAAQSFLRLNDRSRWVPSLTFLFSSCLDLEAKLATVDLRAGL
jgi:hypothetical protein